MTDKEIIRAHLTNYYNTSLGFTYFSGFCGALKDARKMTGRNIELGVKDNSNNFGHLGSWLGTLGYLSLLDQIGNCFKLKNGPTLEENKSGIIKSLTNFSNLSENEIDVIYALRNSFAHDFSLLNNGRRAGLKHHFSVDNSAYNPMIILPSNPWDGDIENMDDRNETYVNLQALGDFVEKLVKDLIQYNENDRLEIVLPGGSNELKKRYSFVTGEKIL